MSTRVWGVSPEKEGDARTHTHNERIRDEVAGLIDVQKGLLDKKKQLLRMASALEFIGVKWDNVKALDFREGNMVAGVWLVERDYSTKQRGEPSDYRRFEKPIYYTLNQ